MSKVRFLNVKCTPIKINSVDISRIKIIHRRKKKEPQRFRLKFEISFHSFREISYAFRALEVFNFRSFYSCVPSSDSKSCLLF